MNLENLKRMMDVIKIMEQSSVWTGNMGLVFEKNTLTGIVYRNELGYCAFGDSDGQSLFVDVKQFEKLNAFMDVLRANKMIKDDKIYFKTEDQRQGQLDKMGEGEINLKPWAEGKNIDLKKEEIFNLGSDLTYYLLNNNFCYTSTEFFGKSTLTNSTDFKFKLSASFIKVFDLGWATVKTVEDGVIFVNDDLEVMLLSGVEGIEVALDEKFDRDASAIKGKKSLVIDNPESFQTFLAALAEMRSIGADMVTIMVEGKKIFIQSIMGVGLRRQLDIPFTEFKEKKKSGGEGFSGSIYGSAIDVLWKMKENLTSLYVDGVMCLFEGPKTNIICHLADKLVWKD